MQIDWLKTFVAIVDNNGFSAAAESIFRFQSRVSAHIAALESEIGAKLFDRRQRPVALTDSGRTFLSHARAILNRLEISHADIAAVKGLRTGRVALGTYPSASAAFLPSLLAEFKVKYPGIQLELVELSVHELDAQLVSNRISLALRPTCPPLPLAIREDVEGIVLWREPLNFVLPTDHQHAGGDSPLDIEMFSEERFIVPRTVVDPSQSYMNEFVRRRIAFLTDYPQTLIALVQSGLGIGLTNHLALLVSNQANVVVRDIADPSMSRDVGLYWNTKFYRSAATDVLYDTIISAQVPPGTTRRLRVDNQDSSAGE